MTTLTSTHPERAAPLEAESIDLTSPSDGDPSGVESPSDAQAAAVEPMDIAEPESVHRLVAVPGSVLLDRDHCILAFNDRVLDWAVRGALFYWRMVSGRWLWKYPRARRTDAG